MNNTPKIMVIKLKELICLGACILLAIFLISLLIVKSKSCSHKSNTATSGNLPVDQTIYNPGTYTAYLDLNNSSIEIIVNVDSNGIKEISIKDETGSVSTMYPLILSAIEDINTQLAMNTSIEKITYPDDCRYTYLMLINSIKTALDKSTHPVPEQ